MSTVRFFCRGEDIIGFEIDGHATENEADIVGKTVCSALSSAAYMTVNTLTEVVGAKADLEIDDAAMRFSITSKVDASQAILEGFWLHVNQLSKEYGQRITVLSEG